MEINDLRRRKLKIPDAKRNRRFLAVLQNIF